MSNDPDRKPHKFKIRKQDAKRLNTKHGMMYVPCYGEECPPKEEKATHSTSKRPRLGNQWQKNLKDWRPALYYVHEKRAHLGGMPKFMRPPHFVADVDNGGKDAVLQITRRIGKPRAMYETFSTGKYHLWYPCEDAMNLPDGGDMIINGIHIGEIKTGNTILSNMRSLREQLDANDPDPLPLDVVMKKLGINERSQYDEPIFLHGERVFSPKSFSLKEAIDAWPPAEGARRPAFFKLACWCGKWNDKNQWDRLLQKGISSGISSPADMKRQAVNGWNKGQEDATNEEFSPYRVKPLGIDRF